MSPKKVAPTVLDENESLEVVAKRVKDIKVEKE